jgi:hypothetical protein
MTSRDFVYWLQGFFELSDVKTLDEKQVTAIKNHLNLVFYHEIDPSEPGDPKVSQQVHDKSKNKLTNTFDSPFDKTLIRC